MPQLAQAALGVGLCAESLKICWGHLNFERTAGQDAIAVVQQLCRGLQGLRRAISFGPYATPGSCAAKIMERQQRIVLMLQQTVQGRGVEVCRGSKSVTWQRA